MMSREQITERLAAVGYVADRELPVALQLMEMLGRPLLLEGEAGVGKTEVAKALAAVHGTALIRLQCYEGLDQSTALYEWNYQRQLLAIRAREVAGVDPDAVERDIFSERFLLERPLLAAIRRNDRPVLLIDEVDRADEEFEAFLLELLSDFQVSIPELGTIKASSIPRVVLTSNSTRELSDALRRRCLYHYVDYPDVRARDAHHPGARAGHRRGARRADRAHGGGRAQGGAAQGAGRRRDAGLGRGAAGPRGGEPARCSRDGLRDAALPAEDAGGPRAPDARGSGAPARKGRLMSLAPRAVFDRADVSEHALARLAGFTRMLRDNGFAVGLKESEDAARVLASDLAARAADLRPALKALFCARRSDWLKFDQVFDAYWLGRGRARVVHIGAHNKAAKRRRAAPARRTRRPSATKARASATRCRTRAATRRRTPTPAVAWKAPRARSASPRPTSARSPIRTPMAEAHALAARLARTMRTRLSRRERARSKGRRVDLRRTIRRNVCHGGVPIELMWRKKKRKPLRLVVLLDASGSMSLYTSLFLRFIHGVLDHFREAEAFLFHTRLVHVSAAMREKDVTPRAGAALAAG